MNKSTIPNKLLAENKIKILGEYTGSANHHDLECLICGHVWCATPKSKTRTLVKNGVRGCPECTKLTKQRKTIQKLINVINKRGLTFLRVAGYYEITRKNRKNYDKSLIVRVRNDNCGHEFESRATNIKYRNVKCPVCNRCRKQQWSKDQNNIRSKKYRKTASDWEMYRADVHSLTRKIYNENKLIINPMGLPRGKAGVEGAYQLDHIRAARYCFDNNIPVEECANIDNLQMLTWEENLSKKDKLIE